MRWLFTIFFTFYGVLILLDVIGIFKPWEWGIPASNFLLWGGLALAIVPVAIFFWYLLEQEPEEEKSSPEI